MKGVLLAVLLLGVGSASRAGSLGAVMPVGDSITNGDWSYNLLGYRDDLAGLLNALGIDFAYVGDVTGEAEDPRYPGHFLPGGVIEQFYPPWFGNGWGNGEFDIGPVVQDLHPDVLLIHLGTNNLTASGQTPAGPYSFDGGQTLHRSFAGYMAELIAYIVGHYGGSSPATPLIVLSLIIPIENKVPEVMAFNAYLEEMALDMARGAVTGEPVHVVLCDQFGPFIENPLLFTGEPGDFMHDGVHPNDAGYTAMAHSYLDALLDLTPPGTVTDLTVWGQGSHSVRIWWSAPGDDYWVGQAASVHLAIWDRPITTESDFESAWELVRPQPANPPGAVQQLTAGGLPGGHTYWLALRVVDDTGNVSPVSNSPSAAIAWSDSVVDTFDEAPAPGVWDLGEDYYVDSGVLRCASPWPIWSAPAMCIGELGPWGAELGVPEGVPASETGRAGLVVLGEPSRITDGVVLRCIEEVLELRRLEGGVVGAVIDTASSSFGALTPGARLGAFPFVFEGAILIRTTRDGLPDRVLSTGLAAQSLPGTRCAGIVMQGALGWGVDDFRLEGPGLWDEPEPFHLLSPDSGTTVGSPPTLVWRAAFDADPWDAVTYEVLWSTDPGFSPGFTSVISCGKDTTVQFPPAEFIEGRAFYWRVRAEDGVGLVRESVEQGWWFQAATGAEGDLAGIRILSLTPNPSRGVIRVGFQTPFGGHLCLDLFDVAGRQVACTARHLDPGLGFVAWSIPASVAKGTYLLRLGIAGTEARSLISLAR